MKYKVWHIGKERFIQDDTNVYMDPDGDVFEIDEGTYGYMYKNVITDSVKIVRSTGLKDRNGVEIYEGDIIDFVEFDNNGTDYRFKGVVKNAQGMWQIWRNWNNEFWGSDGAFFLWGVHQNDDEIEIIGNIYEHPHLLSKEEEQT